MTEILVLLISIVVIIWCWVSMHKDVTSSRTKIPNNPKPIEAPNQVEVVDNKLKFTPPMYELEQWIRDNFRKIKVMRISSSLEIWEVKSELINCVISLDIKNGYSTNYGLSGAEVEYLVDIYYSLYSSRWFKLDTIKQDRSRKQLARKLQKLGYGEGKYA